MPDCHVGAGGGLGCLTGDWKALPGECDRRASLGADCAERPLTSAGFNQSGINCETNAAISTILRAMQEASDLQQWFN